MTTKSLTTKQIVYRQILTDDRYEGIRWIANVLATSCGRPTSRLRALVALVDAGREVSPAGFIMPYEALSVDGRVVVAMPLLDRGEEIAYDVRDWHKY